MRELYYRARLRGSRHPSPFDTRPSIRESESGGARPVVGSAPVGPRPARAAWLEPVRQSRRESESRADARRLPAALAPIEAASREAHRRQDHASGYEGLGTARRAPADRELERTCPMSGRLPESEVGGGGSAPGSRRAASPCASAPRSRTTSRRCTTHRRGSRGGARLPVVAEGQGRGHPGPLLPPTSSSARPLMGAPPAPALARPGRQRRPIAGQVPHGRDEGLLRGRRRGRNNRRHLGGRPDLPPLGLPRPLPASSARRSSASAPRPKHRPGR